MHSSHRDTVWLPLSPSVQPVSCRFSAQTNMFAIAGMTGLRGSVHLQGKSFRYLVKDMRTRTRVQL